MSNIKITQDHIDIIVNESKYLIQKVGEKTTVVLATLPNGFVILESSSCVDPANFDEEVGVEICKNRIENKIWELEGYVLQTNEAGK